MNKEIIVIAGPTASGKSSLAIKLAKEIGGYIINADSRQVYEEISIGTAKPTPDEVKDGHWIVDGIKHYLYDYVPLKERYSIYQFQKDVHEVIKKEDPKLHPILVGGTGLYIDSVVFNFKLSPLAEQDVDLEKLSIEELQELAGGTLDSLNESDRENSRRVMALIKRGSKQTKGAPFPHKYLVMDIDREILKERMAKRVDLMFEIGLEEENRQLIEKGYTYDTPGLDTIGYKEFGGYFRGEKTIEKVKEQINTDTRRYAKRQRTWFKRNKNAIYISNLDEILQVS